MSKEYRIDISIWCNTCGKEIWYGFISDDTALDFNLGDHLDLIPHQKHHLTLKDRNNISINKRRKPI